MITALPPVRLEPGWYWYHVERASDQEKAWEVFSRANIETLKVRKSFAGDTARALVFVFELRQPIAWTLPGVPSKAPRKLATELRDLSSSEQVRASPDLAALVAEAGSNTSGALTLLVWGGAAVLLFNLFRSTRPREVVEEA